MGGESVPIKTHTVFLSYQACGMLGLGRLGVFYINLALISEVVEVLLDAKADPDSRDGGVGCTALHSAGSANNVEAIALLLQATKKCSACLWGGFYLGMF